MQQVIRLEAIEQRARRVNLTFSELLQRTPGVTASTVYRWKAGISPRMDVYERVIGALEGTLDAEERRLRDPDSSGDQRGAA